MILNSPYISGSITVTGNSVFSGSITVSGGISGSNAQSASYALTASNAVNAQSASNAVNAVTASSADNLLVRNTLTAQTIVVQTITSSIDWVTGSAKFGSVNTDAHTFTGSVSISGSSTFGLNVNAGALYVSSSGRVGIGTTNPTAALQVSGSTIISNNQNSLTRLIITNTTTGTNSYVETTLTSDSSAGSGAVGKFSSTTTPYKITTASNTFLYNGSTAGDIAILNDFASGNIKFATGGSSTSQMFISASGNIGIGITNPFTRLTIFNGGANTSTNYQFKNISVTSGFFSGYTGTAIQSLLAGYDGVAIYATDIGYGYDGTGYALMFSTNDDLTGNPIERMRITSGGNVYIGDITGADGRLMVKTSVAVGYSATAYNGTNANIRLMTGGTAATGVTTGISMGVGGAAEAYIGAVQNSSTYADIVFQTYVGSYGERMRITSGGDVGIGNTAFSSTRLTVTGKSTTSSDYSFVANNSANTNLFLVRNDGTHIFQQGGGTESMRITSGGNLQLKNPYYLFLNSTSTTTLISGLPTGTSLLISVTIQWSSNSAAQRTYLLHVGATTTAWGSPNSGITTISSLDWSSGYVGAATFSVGGSGSSRTLDISVSGANTYNVDVYASMVRFGY